jgi:hypothetical protein
MSPLLAMLFACVTPDPPPVVPTTPPPPAPAERIAKAKTKTAKAGAEAAPALGVAGPGTLEMQVQATDTSTEATMALTFSDGSSRTIPLGKVPGRCTSVQPVAVEYQGQSLTPLFTFDCVAGGKSAKGHVAQLEDMLVVVQVDARPNGTPKIKILKKLSLVSGVTLTRKV